MDSCYLLSNRKKKGDTPKLSKSRSRLILDKYDPPDDEVGEDNIANLLFDKKLLINNKMYREYTYFK